MSLFEEEPMAQTQEKSKAPTIALIVIMTVAVAAGAWYWTQKGSPPPESPRQAHTHRPAAEAPVYQPAMPSVPSTGTLTIAPRPSSPTAATLHVESDIPGASVFLDRAYLGTTPITEKNIAPGTHQLNVSVSGYEGHAEEIELQPGTRDIDVRFREVTLNTSITAIHKHAFGSCQGRLTATLQGLKYEPSKGNDGFIIPLGELERFDVDYPKKILRIKRRGGKSYDFTDPEGNADRLYVYYQEVTKARDRLAKGDPAAN